MAGKYTPELGAEIYTLSCPDTGEVRYIGKANDSQKRLKSHIRDSRRRNTPLYCWMRKLAAAGKSPVVNVVCWASDWKAAEISQIAAARAAGAKLLNVADGGDQPKVTKEQLVRNAAALNSHMRSNPEKSRIRYLKARISASLRGGYVTNATRQRLRLHAAKMPELFGCWANIPDRKE